MKIHVASDLHLEFEKGFDHTLNIPSGDVLILAGDVVCPWRRAGSDKAVAHSFFEEVNTKFKHVLYVMGNHEYYGGTLCDTANEIRKFITPYENITLLDGDSIVIDNVGFFGDTFWYDARQAHPEVMWDIKRGMNDYSEIKYSFNDSTFHYTPLDVCDITNQNFYSRHKLNEFMTKCEEDTLFPIVITHHAPSFDLCVEQCYKLDNLSYAYANTGMNDLISTEYPKHIWIHGHMHKRDTIEHDNGLIICNSRGYIGYEPHGFVSKFEFKEFEV